MKKYDLKQIDNLLGKSKNKDPLSSIDSYNSEMTISQVVKFFQKQEIIFTKTMIQNYVRIGLLPPPLEKRFYNNSHLYMLTMIDSLKTMYSLDEMKNFFKIILNNFDSFEDTFLDMTSVYKNYFNLNLEKCSKLQEDLVDIFNENDYKISEISNFFIIMQLMVSSIASKKTAQLLLNNQFNIK